MNIRRILSISLVTLLVAAILLGAGGFYYFGSYLPVTVAPQSFPRIDGEIRVDGLEAPVDVYRDAMGIPHIYAASLHDLFFAQGYVHAQDRFWQMDTWRHIGSGRLSEMFGAAQLEMDSFLRTLGWRLTAQQEWEQLGPDSKARLQAYSDGVNAYLEDHGGTALSLEYAILKLLSPDYEIEPWEPVHSLTWGKAMAWDLRANLGEEIERAILLKTLTPAQVDELFPPYPLDHPTIVNRIDESTGRPEQPGAEAFAVPTELLDAVRNNAALLDPVLGSGGDGVGSNSWAIGGALTDTGMPLLANDPHLGIQMPSIWYQVGLHCQPGGTTPAGQPPTDVCDYEVGGFSFAGVPGVIIGHNDRIAWGFTNVGPDVMDLYIERVNPENPDQYEVNGEWVEFETRTETIEVAGGQPVELTVRLTRHGPVISESYGPLKNTGDETDAEFVPFRDKAGLDLPEDYVLALRWTALTPSTPFEAVWGFNQADNWDEFRQAAREFHVPAQNLLYADVDGNIGYQMPGDIPIRAGGDGRFPVPGWTDDYEWTGFIPFEELPYTFNPPEGYIATANNRIPPAGYPYEITADWDYGYRATRIVQMIENAPGPIDMAYVQAMQGDSYDAGAEVFLPVLFEMENELPGSEQGALELLMGWDYQAGRDSASAALYEAFWGHLLTATFADDLPEDYLPEGGDRWFTVMRSVVSDPASPWWDDQSTADKVESRADIFVIAFTEAVAELEKELGRNPSDWRWGDLHAAWFDNQTLGVSGVAPIEALFNRGPFATGGGKSIVNATSWDVSEGYQVTDVPSMRMIVDLGDLDNSVTVHTTGQSGHAYHPHYDDMIPMWADLEYYAMLWEQAAILADAEGHLRLAP